MDLAMVVLTGVAALAALASAIVSVVQASMAKCDRVDAELARDEALVIQREIADAQSVVADSARRSPPPE